MRNSIQKLLLVSFVLIIGLSACEQTYLPKPKAYNRIDLPESAYQVLPDTFPYHFFYSQYAELSRDTFPKSGRYYINLFYPDYDAVIQITYKDLKKPENNVEELLTEAFDLTMKHNPKAYSIRESIIPMRNNQVASIAELAGEVPSQFQFFTTDSTTHFFRGALYFNTANKNDSLRPIIDFIKKDAIEMLNSLEWKY
ncbi:gliding motility lipoprotein GldD [Roseivirga echinicomitans]|uniref:gliding motility lipoprotein GldD n=1 Tax=Roseivirga echinicomitans TaxID=296218 RepID=UPI000A859043|nr:gliding motility lipoprotein GldD [Roseivirga echinicomitans]